MSLECGRLTSLECAIGWTCWTPHQIVILKKRVLCCRHHWGAILFSSGNSKKTRLLTAECQRIEIMTGSYQKPCWKFEKSLEKKNSMHFMKLRSLPPENVQHHQKERIEKRPTIIFRGEIREDWGNLAEKCLCGGSAGCKQGHGSMDTCTTDELLGIPGEQKRWVDQWKNGKGAMCEFERLWL